MLIGFFDDTDLLVDDEDRQPDIFVYGGYFIRHNQLESFQMRIGQVKMQYNLMWFAPIKWNMRDTSLVDFYMSHQYLGEVAYQVLLKDSDAIRHDLLAVLQEFDATILISARYDIARHPEPARTYHAWAYENMLQRVGLMAQTMKTQSTEASSTLLVTDWPSRDVGKGLFDIYTGGYYFGRGMTTKQSYNSGPLWQFRFADSLVHGSTMHSGPLQIADLVVGCCRDFIYWIWKGERLQRIQGVFDLLIERFYRDPQGRINNAGFKLAKVHSINVDSKIQEYLTLTHKPIPEDDIPF